MELIKANEYEDLSMAFQHQIVKLLDKTLAAKGVAQADRSDICGDFLFDLAMLLDEGAIEQGEKSYSPTVAFESSDQLYVNSGVLFHEYAFGVASDYFEKSDT
ncbi:MAG: hypothetical protein ABL891_18750 [Burkholderiales bacterium]